MNGIWVKESDRSELLREAAARTSSDPLQLKVRDFIGWWNASARGARVVESIQRDLQRYGLATEPDFRAWGLGATIRIVDSPSEPPDQLEGKDEIGPESLHLQIGNLPSASRGVVSVSQSHELQTATTLMIQHDFSQLAVMEGERSLNGAVTWESIGRAQLRGRPTLVAEVLVPIDPVAYDADALSLVGRIYDAGFVFVRGGDSKITGIVTTADLSLEFSALARPFFLLGEIERRLRHLIEGVFSQEELAAVRDPSDDREIRAASDLSLGELERLLQPRTSWERLSLPVDRTRLLQAFTRTREIRNDIMHFSPDPPGEDDVEHLRGFIRLLRIGE